MTTAQPKLNRYGADCANCHRHVPPGFGRLVTRKPGGRWTVVCHGDHAAECLSATQNQAIEDARARRRTQAERYAGMTWEQVMEANEFFDGEPTLIDAAREAWTAANTTDLVAVARRNLDRKYWPHIDARFGNVDEMVMHAMDEYADRHEA